MFRVRVKGGFNAPNRKYLANFPLALAISLLIMSAEVCDYPSLVNAGNPAIEMVEMVDSLVRLVGGT